MRARFHLTDACWAVTMGFLLPRTPYYLPDGILLLFKDPNADSIRALMPVRNKYGVASTTKIETSDVPEVHQQQEESPGGSTPVHGDISRKSLGLQMMRVMEQILQ